MMINIIMKNADIYITMEMDFIHRMEDSYGKRLIYSLYRNGGRTEPA